MASRESQGLQVALILFVMITVVLALTTYVYFRKSEEMIRKAEAAAQQQTDAKSKLDVVQFENQLLKHMLGYKRLQPLELDQVKKAVATQPDMPEIIQNFDLDMATYGAGLPEADMNYRKLPENLLTAIRVRNESLVDSTMRERALTVERDRIQKDGEDRLAEARKQLQAAVQDYAVAQRTYNEETTRTTAEKQQIAQQLAAKLKEYQQLAATSQAEIAKRDTALTALGNQYETALERIEEAKDPAFERPDGEITWVNQRSGVVWIDLGSADGLERQMTFSVYAQDASGVANAPVKARIEVTKIIDDHVAEARIIEDDLTDPIMDHDKIYSPSFRKGQRTRFALAGLLDIDGDGKSDQEKVKAIITQNGGVIDAELLPTGEIIGKMTLETRYLVKGEAPTDKSNVNLTKGYTQMIDEATRLRIDSISLTTLLDRMGYRPERRVVPLNRGGTGGAGATNRSNQFRRRSPTTGSAYP